MGWGEGGGASGGEFSRWMRWQGRQVTDRSCDIRDCRDDMGVNRGEGHEDMWSRTFLLPLVWVN